MTYISLKFFKFIQLIFYLVNKGELDQRDKEERDTRKSALKDMEKKQKEQERIKEAQKEAR